MALYQKFCTETFNEASELVGLDFHYPENFNFAYDVVDELARTKPEAQAMLWCNAAGEERSFSFADISRSSNQMAQVLSAAGVTKGDVVVVMLKRHHEYWPLAMALSKLGAIMAPVTHMLTIDDLKYRIDAANIKTAVCTPHDGGPAKFVELLESSSLKQVFTIIEDAPSCRNLSREMQSASTAFERVPNLASDPALLYFTSGTTGQPKGVCHPHSYPLAHLITAKYWHNLDETSLHFTVAETGWAKSSWGKLYGQWLCEAAVFTYDFDSFDARGLLEVMRRHEVTSFCAPPTIYRYLIKTGLEKLPALRYACAAGEPLSPETAMRFEEACGLAIKEGYGQTETTLLLLNTPWMQVELGSIGKPNPLYQVFLADAQGNPVPQGEIGEIVVAKNPDGSRPLGIFSNYFANDELYEQAWEGGLYHTGDTAWMDEQGYYWFNGRKDDIIKTGGYRVGPYEIENVLIKHPSVLECSVVGIPDKQRGQKIKAYMTLSPGFEASPALNKEVKRFVNEQISAYKWIRELEFCTELPKTISGKIKKKDLRARHEESPRAD